MPLDLYGQKSGGNRNAGILHNEIIKLGKRPEGKGKRRVEERIAELLSAGDISMTPQLRESILQAKPSPVLLEKIL